MDGLSRYKPFVATLAGILLLAVILPGSRRVEDPSSSGVGTTGVAAGQSTEVGQINTFDDPSADATAADGTFSTGATGGTAGASGAVRTTGAGRSVSVGNAPASRAVAGNPLDAPDCDKATGRTMIPSFYSPNCVAIFPKGTDNGGATWKGVTKDTVTIAIYQAPENEAASAAVAAAGVEDTTSDDEDDQNRDKVIEAWEAHVETYGRHVKWVKVQGTGEADDDAAAKSDAIKVADEIKAFASFGAPNNTYVSELSARGVLCFCTVSQPIENYLKWRTVYSILMSSSQGYIHRAEYTGKRLARRQAKYAGDPVYKNQERRFGLIYFETSDGAYKAGADFFEKIMQEKYGVRLTDRVDYLFDLAASQEQARTIVARFKDRGVTSVLFAGDPIYPAFFTQESTRQAYFPEWIITGSALTDTTLFARTYDQQQWRNAFGISFLVARVSPAVDENEPNIYEWHFGEALSSAPGSLAFGQLYTGIQLAGPRLNPDTFREGIFSLHRTGGFITQYATSYGRGVWPWDDYLALDDTTEIWWDPEAQGPDELGAEGVGMYRYVDKGKRYMPGEWPSTEVKPFVRDNTVTMYNTRPDGEVTPLPPHKHVRITPAQHWS